MPSALGYIVFGGLIAYFLGIMVIGMLFHPFG